MVKVLILLLFLFICNEGGIVKLRRIYPVRTHLNVYIHQRNPTPYFNPSLSAIISYSTQTTKSTTKFHIGEDQAITMKRTTLDNSDTTSTTDASETTSVHSTSTTSVTSDAITSELTTLYKNSDSVPDTTETTYTNVVSESTSTASSNTISGTSELSTISENKTTRSTTYSDAPISSTAANDTTSSIESTTTQIIINDSTHITSFSTEKVSTLSSNTPTFVKSTKEPYYTSTSIVDGSGSGGGDGEDIDHKSTTILSLQPIDDEDGSASGDDEERDTTTTVKRTTIIVAATTPAANQDDNNNEGSGDDNFSGDDIGSGTDVMHQSSTKTKKNVNNLETVNSDFTFDEVDDLSAIETEKAANPNFLKMFSASFSPPEKMYKVEFIPEVINSDTRKRVALPTSTSKTTNRDRISNDADDLERVTDSSVKEINTESTTGTQDTATMFAALAKEHTYTFDINNDLDNNTYNDKSSIDEGYEQLPRITNIALKLETKTKNQTQLFPKIIVNNTSSKHGSTSAAVTMTKSSPDMNVFQHEKDKITENNPTSNKQQDKEPYGVIADHILKLERGNLDEDYYIIVDGHDYTLKPLSKNKTIHDENEKTDKVYDSVGNATNGKGFENRKNNIEP